MDMGRVISGFLLDTEPWDRENRKRGSTRNGVRTMAFTFLVISILIGFYVFFVSSRLWVINLGYKTSRAFEEQKDLIEVNEKLKIERATLISPEQIDSYARKKLGMREPQENQIRSAP